jgi:MFS family permease
MEAPVPVNDAEKKELVIKRLCRFFVIIYAVQGLSQSGVSGLFSLPVSLMLKNRMHFDQAQLAYFTGLVMIPWAIKPLYGLLSDFVPIFGWRRRSWFVIAAGLVMSSALYLANFCNFAYGQLLFFLTATALGIAFCDVLCDAVMVENGKRFDLVHKFQGIQWKALYVASIFSGIGGGLIAKYFNYSQTFWLMAFLPLIIFLAAVFFVPEKRYQYREMAGESEMKSLMTKKDAAVTVSAFFAIASLLFWLNAQYFGLEVLKFIMLVTPFLILGSLAYLFKSVIDKKVIFCMIFLFWWDFALFLSSAPFLYYQLDTLGFSEVFLGTLGTLFSVGAAFGSCLFAVIAKKRLFWGKRVLVDLSLDKMLFYALIIGAATILTNFMLIGVKSAIVLNLGTGLGFLLANLTILVIAAKFCPPRIEGTFFALLMSVINLGSSMSALASGWLYKTFVGLAPINFTDNFWARFLVWLGWPTQHAQAGVKFDIFAQYYAIGWLTIISLCVFSLYFVVLPYFSRMIQEDKKLEELDIHPRVLVSRIREGAKAIRARFK